MPAKKISKTAAKYQPYPKGLKRCSGCTMFVKPDACTLVLGDIQAFGYCIHHEVKK